MEARSAGAGAGARVAGAVGPGTPTSAAAKWIGGLDGLRAVAVIAVVLFHLNPGYLSAGFLGVDLFFVISGYLITRLLLAERARSGRVRLGRFYLRRARRLLPAVVALLAVVGVFGWLLWPDQRPTLPGSVLSSLGYVTNWWMIADQQSYFVAMGRPPLLQHLWSLAIEEQFYLLWAPVVVILTGSWMARSWMTRSWTTRSWMTRRTRPAVVVAGVAGLLAVCSTVAMTVIALRTNVPYQADSSRVYFGTDTHAMGLLIGAAAGALAAVPWRSLTRGVPRWVRPAWRATWRPRPLLPAWLVGSGPVDDGGAIDGHAAAAGGDDGRPADRSGARGPLPVWVTDAAAVAGLAAMVAVFVAVDEYLPALYRGGFTLFSLVAVATICAAARRGSRVGALLDVAPLAWIGRRSYGIYLWHWPILVVTRPMFDVQGPEWLIDAARTGLVLVIAALSYRYLETPIRRDGFAVWLRAVLSRLAAAWRRLGSAVRSTAAPGAAVEGAGAAPGAVAGAGTGAAAGAGAAAAARRRNITLNPSAGKPTCENDAGLARECAISSHRDARAGAGAAPAAAAAGVAAAVVPGSPAARVSAPIPGARTLAGALHRRLAPGAAATVVLAVVCAGVLVTAGFAAPRANDAAAEPVPAAPLAVTSPALSSAPVLTFPSGAGGEAISTAAPSSAPTRLETTHTGTADSAAARPRATPSSEPAASSPSPAATEASTASPIPAAGGGAAPSRSTTEPPASTSTAPAKPSPPPATASAPPSDAATSVAPTPKPVAKPPVTTTLAPPKAPAAAVSAFGDSVLLGAAPAVQAAVGSLSVDAVVGRQAWDTLAAIAAARQARSLASVVLIHTGNNGVISPKQLATTLDSLADRARVVLVNDHVDRSWQGPNNKTIAAAGAQHPNVVVVDWNAAAVKNPAWFGPDGIHVNGAGAKAYAALIAKALGG